MMSISKFIIAVQDYLDEGAFLNLHLVQEVVEFQRVKFQQVVLSS